ncbi:MAG: hypothetical protein HDP34_03770 [Clostridia bacterium]|nr:hypothetical protein [Clostridia bacterium]
MNKKFKGAICAVVGASMLLTATAGCNKENLDPEVRQLQLSTSALDGNFNPFFYTSGNDGNMISLTQIGMMTNDENGNLVCGEDQPTAVLDYKVTMKDRNGNVSTDGDTQGSTEYEFVIKNGIKFSDGEPLTIKDVLFNLYVYLDRTYTGSSTIYSTNIKGLKAYREQQYIDDDAVVSDSKFTSAAIVRIQNLIQWSDDMRLGINDLTEQQAKDLATTRELFREEAESDWTNISTSWQESYKDSYRFTATWQAYLFNEGLVAVQQKPSPTGNGTSVDIYDDLNSNGEKDDGELYYTTLDKNQPLATNTTGAEGEVTAQDLIDEVTAAASSDKVSAYMKKEGCTEEQAIEALQRAYCIDLVVKNYTSDAAKSKISAVLQYWGTASSALQEFTGDEITKYYDKIKEENNGELLIKTISGITTYKTNSFNGKFGATLNGQHDVLKIVINGIDPKAIYNFSFTVSPMHYYSGGEALQAALDDNNETVTHFGVDAGNSDFFKDVVQAPEKQGLPVGAGAYMATTESGGDAEPSTFFKNNIVYFKRNDNFTTLGSGIENAKIKYVNYKVYNDDKILTALIAKEIDFGTPNATSTNTNLVTINKKFLASKTYDNNGYGYVGINPKYVPELYVRQAIMKAMNARMTVSYYSGTATQIYRPLSKTSWAYPEGVGQYDSISYSTEDDDIIALVEKAGYTRPNGTGVYTKTSTSDGNISHASLGTKLKFSFTIAGESKDHPAYQMFLAARDRLNGLGFDISVKTDIQALKSLNTGGLEVWAAAYTSTIDPDMYQVYHKDSNATSVNNWNYKNILNAQAKWPYEYEKIQTLSKKIEQAREIYHPNTETERALRSEIYNECYNLVMDLAIQLPTYQRSDLAVYNKNRIKESSLVAKPNSYIGLFDKIWEIEYV